MNFTIFGRSFHFFSEYRQWAKFRYYAEEILFRNHVYQMALLLILIVGLLVLFSFKSGRNYGKHIRWISFGCYLLALILLFLVGKHENGIVRGFRGFDYHWYLAEGGFHETRILKEILCGIVFVPLGYLLRWAGGEGHVRGHWMILAMIAVMIEVCQVILGIGECELTHMTAYCVGAVVGYGIRGVIDHGKC